VTRYELLDRIGVGGMAEIFRGKAVAAGGFEKPVAIKRILPHLSQDKRFVELLIAEAKVLSLLKHRNIVQIFDVGLGDDGKYFLVMEYVDGKDLGAVFKGLEVKRRRMPFDLVLHIGAEICEALEHAHSARAPDGKPMSLVHRDVSPSNVLLSRAGEIKLTDFGIAKRAEQEHTGTGAVRGKFAYISPEQARNEPVDPRSDVFSVAVVLWELITNKRMFSGLGDLEALRAVREAQVRRPREVDPQLSQEVDELLMSALARDVRRRPTAGQFGQKLRALRYSLDLTVGDPATELGKIIDDAEQVERQSQQMAAPQMSSSGFDLPDHNTEATVIRIHTADAFSMRDQDGTGMAAALKVIDAFEEEETRLAQLSGDQLRMLRGQKRDSSEMTVPPPRPQEPRSRRPTDEPTTARPPILAEDDATVAMHDLPHDLPLDLPLKLPHDRPHDLPPNASFDADESTRMVAPPSRRTPVPERVKPARQATAPPPQQPQPLPVPLPPSLPVPRPPSLPVPRPPSLPGMGPTPGTVHVRNQPPGQAPFLATPVPQQPPPGNYPQWGVQPQQPPRAPPPAAPDPMLHRGGAMMPPYTQLPPAAGGAPTRKQRLLQPWMLVIGAIVMAVLAFAVTRAFIGK
jgi:serine/threonine protein kinase